jgi:hypothetical protein
MSADGSDIQSMLLARGAQGQGSNIDQLLAERAAGGLNAPPTVPSAPQPLSGGARFAQGIADLPTGLGQIAEHVATTPLNWIRAGIRGTLNAAGQPEVAGLFGDVDSSGFDKIVAQRESDYQNARQNAQQSGIDWWRLGGQAANPLNYMVPGGAGATVAGRIATGAAQGAAVAASQPSTVPGNFWWDKAKGTLVGGATGGLISGAIEGTIPLIKAGIGAVKNAVGATSPASGPAAEAVVNSALNAKGIDPASVDLNVLAGMKADAQAALEHETPIDAETIAARAKAESLPFPLYPMKGQASGNAMQFAEEQNLRGIKGVGEPLTQRLTEQNAGMINNLDALGAKNAPDPVSTGQVLSDKVQSFWDGLQTKKDALYDAVRNSKGQPAAMDQFTAAQNIHDALDTPQAGHAYDLLPSNIRTTIDDLQDGKLPLTVGQMQAFDKLWGSAQRGADGSTAYAIGVARRELNNAPISDEVGQQAQQAYQAARAAHAQQMSLVDPKLPNGMPNPQYQPLVDDVVYGGKPPETLFQKHFMGAAPSVAEKNMAFASQLDPSMPQQIGQTYMGEIKRLALNNASDERGTVSNAVLSGFAHDPVKAARMEALLPDPAVQTFRNLADSVEMLKRFPTAAAVNTSGTTSAAMNVATSALKSGAMEKLTRVTGKIPVVGPLLNAKDIATGLEQSRLQTGVQEALNPGVSLKSLLTATPAQAARRSLAGRVAIPAAVGAANEE